MKLTKFVQFLFNLIGKNIFITRYFEHSLFLHISKASNSKRFLQEKLPILAIFKLTNINNLI